MSTLTIRLPNAMHVRLDNLAQARGVSINKLIEEMTIATLAAHDAGVRFKLLAAGGRPTPALAVLDRLDGADKSSEIGEPKRPFHGRPRRSSKKK